MILFNQNIIKILNEHISKNDEYVASILLASYGFAIRFDDFKIHCYEKVFACINGITYEWDDAPNSSPWGSLGRQKATKASLKNPNLLRITFKSGDYIEIQTLEGQYESVIFDFPPKGETIIMEIY